MSDDSFASRARTTRASGLVSPGVYYTQNDGSYAQHHQQRRSSVPGPPSSSASTLRLGGGEGQNWTPFGSSEDSGGWEDVREALQAAERQLDDGAATESSRKLPPPSTARAKLNAPTQPATQLDGLASIPPYMTSPFPTAVSLPPRPFDPWSTTQQIGSPLSPTVASFNPSMSPSASQPSLMQTHGSVSSRRTAYPSPGAFEPGSHNRSVGSAASGPAHNARSGLRLSPGLDSYPLDSRMTSSWPSVPPRGQSDSSVPPPGDYDIRIDGTGRLWNGQDGRRSGTDGELRNGWLDGPHRRPHSSASGLRNTNNAPPDGLHRRAQHGLQIHLPKTALTTSQLNQDVRSSGSAGLGAPDGIEPSSLKPPAGLKLRSGLPERTTYAMWIGNVPTDATEQELWSFFLSRPPLPKPPGGLGLQSIHLIARSQCAFVNLDSGEHLFHMINQCHGMALRPVDVRCKPLVCRVRRTEDDAKSGVGAQRGGGLHKAWVKRQEELDLYQRKMAGEELEKERGSNGSNSSTSTDSGYFSRHFPRRYFILKSHNQFDLEQSVKHGFWSTQAHNEPVLDQAYRTATEGVYIIFSANKSGSWFGVAVMAGPIFSLPQDETDSQRYNRSTSPSSSTTLSLSPGLVGPSTSQTSPASRRPFRIKWLSSRSVPSTRTRHINNSFNSNREVKICRDGTEVEPNAGEQLVLELMNHAASSPTVPGGVLNYTTASDRDVQADRPLPDGVHHPPPLAPGPDAQSRKAPLQDGY